MKKTEATNLFMDLAQKKVQLLELLPRIKRDFPLVCMYPVWTWGDLSVVLLVSKAGKLGGCGILLWGCQFENNPGSLAIKVGEVEVGFGVFDGAPNSRSFAIVENHGQYEWWAFIKDLKNACTKAGVSRIYAKNAKLLESGGVLFCMTEEIENFYMKIARSDGTLIPEFDFINPKTSSAFWSNNG